MSLAVVTGATGALGLPIARRLAQDGHHLLLVDLAEDVEEVASGFDTPASACRADLTTQDGVAAVVAAVDEAGGTVDALVNSAGITRDARLAKMQPDAFSAVIAVNLLAVMRVTFALEDRFGDGSAVVNMSSRAGLGNFGQTNYSASKSGLVGFSRALAQRWAPRVRVNALAPSLVETPMTRGIPEETLQGFIDKIPAGRMGTPEEIAEVVAFLASPRSEYVTGQILLQCGGRSVAP